MFRSLPSLLSWRFKSICPALFKRLPVHTAACSHSPVQGSFNTNSLQLRQTSTTAVQAFQQQQATDRAWDRDSRAESERKQSGSDRRDGSSRGWALEQGSRSRNGDNRRQPEFGTGRGSRGRGRNHDGGSGSRSRNGRFGLDPETAESRRAFVDDYIPPPSLMLEAAKSKGVPIMVLKRGKARLFWEGQPIVFRGAVETMHGDPRTGDVVALSDANMQAVGWGIYNSHSLFCLRMMQMAREVDAASESAFALEPLLEDRINAATALRKDLAISTGSTTVYRLINSEGDRLSGLIVDVFSKVAVVASSAAWVELHQGVIEKLVLAALGDASGKRVIWRRNLEMLKLEGIEAGKQQDDAAEAEGEDVGTEAPAVAADTEVVENDIRFKVALRSGQKTGFYADQRDSRNLIRTLANSKKVLDLCCYSGGFALSAAKGGASEVTGVDSSLPAINLANENLALNGFQQPVTFVRTDVDDFMRDTLETDRQWDIVILDPPKLAPSRKALPKATTRYRKLNAAAMRLVAPGGLLMTCSCSGAVAQGEGLLPIVREAALAVGRKVTLLRKAGAAADHPLDPSYPEGSYLTNLLLRVS